MKTRWTCTFAIGTAMIAGCAHLPADDGFSSVNQIAADHGVAGLVYRPEAEQIATATHKLIAEPLTPASVVQLALINSRRLQAEYESFGISEAKYVQAVTLTNPVLDIDFKVARGQSPKWDVSILQSLIELLNLPASQKIAAAELQAARLRTAEAVLDLARDVRLATLDAQTSERQLQLRQQIAEAAGASGEFADRLNKAGNLSPLDQTRWRVEAAQAKMDLADAQLDAQLARERLASVIGLDDPADLKLAPLDETLPAPNDATNTLHQIERQSLSLAAMKQDLLASGERAGIARDTAWIDQLGVGPAAEREGGHWYVGPALNVSLPVFSQGQAQKLLADATARMQLQSYLADRTELQSAARQQMARLDRARQRVEAYQKTILPLRHQTFDLTQAHYNGMFTDAFGLLRAKEDELHSEVDAISAWSAFWRATINLNHLSAGGSSRELGVRESRQW